MKSKSKERMESNGILLLIAAQKSCVVWGLWAQSAICRSQTPLIDFIKSIPFVVFARQINEPKDKSRQSIPFIQ